MKHLRMTLALLIVAFTVTLTVISVPGYRVARDAFEAMMTEITGQPFRYISNNDANARLAGHFACWFIAAAMAVSARRPGIARSKAVRPGARARSALGRGAEALTNVVSEHGGIATAARPGRRTFSWALRVSAILTLLVILAEAGQMAVPGRNPSLVDAGAGMSGVALATMIFARRP